VDGEVIEPKLLLADAERLARLAVELDEGPHDLIEVIEVGNRAAQDVGHPLVAV
jgi:hypothetical protein